MARSSSQALAAAKAQSAKASQDWTGMCLKFVRTALGISARYASAIAAWNAAAHKHRADVHAPAGAPVFWRIGKFGHIAISAGNGKVWSTDILRRGRVDLVDLDLIHRKWGATYLGWTEDLNGVAVQLLPKPDPKPLELDRTTVPGGHGAQVRALQVGLNAASLGITALVVDGIYGPATQRAVVAFHHKHPEFTSPQVQRDPAIGPKGLAWLVAHS